MSHPDGPDDGAPPEATPAPPPPTEEDPLRRSRTSRAWVAVTALAVVLVLLIIFVAQNNDRVAVHFLGWTWNAPLSVVILTGAVAGMVLAVVAGSLRIWQLHRRVRRTS